MSHSDFDSKIYIFLVDDDSEDQEFFFDALSEVDTPTRLSVFDNGTAVIEELHSSSPLPEVIFLDLYMPGMDGEECVQKIREGKAFDQIPIVIYSTSYDSQQIERLFNLGANHFLQKPLSFRELIASLSAAIASVRKNGVDGAPVYDLVELPQ